MTANCYLRFMASKDKDIEDRIARIEGLRAMTVNERLYLSGLMDDFDEAMVNNKERARQILTWLKVDEPSINAIVNTTDDHR
jgi:hypothetical protein